MRISAYQAQGQDDDKGVFSLLQGAFRSVTGWIGKHNPKSYQVRTPTATIGVRGTDHEPLVIPEGSKEGEPGTYNKVNVGGSFIEAKHGRVDVAPSQAAFAPWRGKPVPRVLAEVPRFFKATRHEAIIAARHEAIHKVIEQRRDERRKNFEEWKKALHERKAVLEKQRGDRKQQLQERRRPQELQRQQQREERRKQWQEGRDRPRQDAGLSQGAEPDRRQQFAEERRKRLDQRRGERENGPRAGEERREKRQQARG